MDHFVETTGHLILLALFLKRAYLFPNYMDTLFCISNSNRHSIVIKTRLFLILNIVKAILQVTNSLFLLFSSMDYSEAPI